MEKEGPMVVIWESLPEQEKTSWLEARRTTGLCGASQKKGRMKSAHLSLAGKSFSSTIQRPPKNGEIALQKPRTSRLPDC